MSKAEEFKREMSLAKASGMAAIEADHRELQMVAIRHLLAAGRMLGLETDFHGVIGEGGDS